MSSESIENVATSDCYAAFEDMVWPKPSSRLDDLQWRMRYAPDSVTPNDLLIAASVMDAYDSLVMCDTVKRETVVAGIRKRI